MFQICEKPLSETDYEPPIEISLLNKVVLIGLLKETVGGSQNARITTLVDIAMEHFEVKKDVLEGGYLAEVQSKTVMVEDS